MISRFYRGNAEKDYAPIMANLSDPIEEDLLPGED